MSESIYQTEQQVPKTKTDLQAEELVGIMSNWGKENPKAAVAVVSVGGLATAYCVYKMVNKLLS
jgi:hypothetical protein